jgi:methionine--tRNA ligase beta chain
METINFEDFIKLEIRIGKILSAERVEGSDKLLKLSVDFGAGEDGVFIVRQIVAGIGKKYEPEAVVGKECPFAYNLAPRMLKGLESQGMILCPSDDTSGPVLLHPDKEIKPGSLVK